MELGFSAFSLIMTLKPNSSLASVWTFTQNTLLKLLHVRF